MSDTDVAVLTTGLSACEIEVDDAMADRITALFDDLDARIAAEQKAMEALLRRLKQPAAAS